MTVEKRINHIKKILNYNVEIDVENKEYIDYIFSKINKISTKNIIKYVKPDTISSLYKRIYDCSELKSVMSLEKMILQYGDELGKLKYNEMKNKMGVTLEQLERRHGKELAEIKWKSYREKQAYTNSFEYKNEKYNWTLDEYNNYNRKRSITKENLIKRHGEEFGNIKWNNYRERQAYTNSKEYLGEKYEIVNSKKGLTLKNFVFKYGENAGELKYKEYIERTNLSYSKISQDLFKELIKIEPFVNNKTYFAENNHEYGIIDTKSGTYKKYDFVCPNLKISIEFHGDHYHGNPLFYSPSDKLKGKGQSKVTAKDIWERDNYKKELLKNERGYDLITIWENDYANNKEKVIKRIIDYVNRNHR